MERKHPYERAVIQKRTEETVLCGAKAWTGDPMRPPTNPFLTPRLRPGRSQTNSNPLSFPSAFRPVPFSQDIVSSKDSFLAMESEQE